MTPDCTHPCIFPWESVFPGPLVLLCVHRKILLTCLSEDKSISFTGCVAQFFFPAGLAYRGCFLLPAMAYDCYVATSKPLLYDQVMPSKLCAFFIAASYLRGFTNTFIVTKGTFALNFCSYNVIDDFFRDISPLEKLACGRKDTYQAALFCGLASNVITPTVLILASYLFISATVLKILSTRGCLKAFSTCSLQLISVTLFYGSVLYVYFHPQSSYSLGRDRIASVFYTVVLPMLNPMIYSLRNKDVKEALNKLLK